METKRTNKETLIKGLKQLGIAIILLFTGPTLLHIILSNREKSFFIPLLIIGLLICSFAIIFIFKGIKSLISSLFD